MRLVTLVVFVWVWGAPGRVFDLPAESNEARHSQRRKFDKGVWRIL